MNHSTVSGRSGRRTGSFRRPGLQSPPCPRGEGEAEDVEIFLHPLPVGGFGDDHHIALQQEAERRLGGGLSVFGADLFQHRIAEKVIFPLREGPQDMIWVPYFFMYVLAVFCCWKTWVSTWLTAGLISKSGGCPGNGPDRSWRRRWPAPFRTVCLLHGPVGAVVVAEGLVDQEQVDVVAAQLL